MIRLRLAVIMALAIILLNGCAFNLTKPGGTVTPEAARAIEAIGLRNTALQSLKGIGKIVVSTKTGENSMRIAWMCVLPEKARFEFIAPGGFPVLSVSTDGKYSYMLAHANGSSFQKVRDKRINLEKLTGIPFEIGDLPQILAGKVPLAKYNAAELCCEQNGSCVLTLKRTWHGIVEKIYFEKNSYRPKMIEFFNSGDGLPSSRIRFNGFKAFKGFEVPTVITFESGIKMAGMLKVQRLWPNVKINENAFILSPPDEDISRE